MTQRTEPDHVAAEIDANLEALARAANDMANLTGDSRWGRVALACLGTRREIRPLLHSTTPTPTVMGPRPWWMK